MKKQRIAIIGAGISGLSAAHYLKQKGYENIILFEASECVGGKIKTVEREGKLYELGGVFVQESFATVKELLAAYGEPLSDKQGLQTMVWKDRTIASNMSLNRRVYGLFKIAKDFLKLWGMMRASNSLSTAGMSQSDPLYFAHFDNLSQQLNMASLPSMIAPFITGMGYGYTDRTPALYQLKLMKRAFGFALSIEINNQFGTNIAGTYLVKNGYQTLLKKMAAQFDVRLNAPVQSVVRNQVDQAAVRLTVNDEQYDFDQVILATPPSNMLAYLDPNKEEASIFEKSKHYYFRSSLFLAKDLPRDKMIFFPDSNQSTKLGYVNSLINWHPELDYFSTYQLFDENTSVHQLDEQLSNTIAELGGQLLVMEAQKVFNYFPHYLENDLLESQPYERLESLQGKNNTFYLGAAICAESVDDSANYAKSLIERFF